MSYAYGTYPPPMTDEWVKSLYDQFDACTTIHELLNASADLHAFRLAPDTYIQGVGLWRKRASELWYGHQALAVATVDMPAVHHAAYAVKKGIDGTPELCVKMLTNISNALNVDYVIVANDCRDGISKFDDYPEYKGDRDEKHSDFYDSLSQSIDACKEAGFRFEELTGLESDDIMCTIAYRGRLLRQKVVIVSADRDMWQALGGGVSIMHQSTKAFSNERWLMAKHFIRPNQAVDWMCLVGKNNIPGATDIGPKTASKWLQAFGDFNGIMNMTKSFTQKQRTAVEQFAENYWKVRSLHTLSREAPVTWGPPEGSE